MPVKDIIVLVIIGGLFIAVWIAFLNLDRVAGKQMKALDNFGTRPIPPDAAPPAEAKKDEPAAEPKKDEPPPAKPGA
jgi:hypothetical protein